MTILSEKNVAGMLVYLLQGPQKENDFTEILTNYYSISTVLNKLLESGLVRSWVDDTRYRARWYELTELGTEIALDLKRAEDRLAGLDPEPSDDYLSTSSSIRDKVT